MIMVLAGLCADPGAFGAVHRPIPQLPQFFNFLEGRPRKATLPDYTALRLSWQRWTDALDERPAKRPPDPGDRRVESRPPRSRIQPRDRAIVVRPRRQTARCRSGEWRACGTAVRGPSRWRACAQGRWRWRRSPATPSSPPGSIRGGRSWREPAADDFETAG